MNGNNVSKLSVDSIYCSFLINMGNLIRNILSQLALNTSDAILAGPLLTSLGLPPGTKLAASAVKAVIKGTAQTVALKAYDDIMERQLSDIEKTKVDRTFDVAEQTFWEYVEKEGTIRAIVLMKIVWNIIML